MRATRETADALWGAAAVDLALGEPEPAAVTVDLVVDLAARARAGPAALARWALSLPWPVFCTVVRVASGDTAVDLVAHPN